MGNYDYKGRPCCQGIMAWELSLEPEVPWGLSHSNNPPSKEPQSAIASIETL